MKRSILVLSTAVFSILGSPLLAAEAETSVGGEMMPMMQEMHTHMQAMQETMKQIRATKDPKERKKLMHKHMQSMSKGMAMMGKMEPGQHEHQAQCQQNDQQCQQMKAMKAEQHDMQQRMQMMRMMMQQMMDHQMAGEEATK